MSEKLIPIEHANVIFYTEKTIGIISIIFCLYIYYISFRFRNNTSINSIIKHQLTLSCIIYMIPYLLSKQPQTENDSFTCKLDSGLFFLALSNTIHFASFLIVLTYMGVKHSDYLEKKEKCLKWALSLITWGISGTGGIFLSIYAEKTTTDDLVCWIVSDAAIITYFLVTLVYMLIVLVLLFIIKKK